MRIWNFGSINIDHVYRVEAMVEKGETISCDDYSIFGGGKGANQSIAIARAGARVTHVGKIGREGQWLVDDMKTAGVDVSRIEVCDKPGGHAIIQVDRNGQNAIVVYGGTNRMIGDRDIDRALAACEAGDMVLVQNEISNVSRVIAGAAARKLAVCFNPAPMSTEVPAYDLHSVSIFVVNESEGRALCGKSEPGPIVDEMLRRYPGSQVVLTLGGKGLLYGAGQKRLSVEATRVKPVDTTGAGDTFIGYLLAALQRDLSVEESLRIANRAAGISVTRKGAASSIPAWGEVAG